MHRITLTHYILCFAQIREAKIDIQFEEGRPPPAILRKNRNSTIKDLQGFRFRPLFLGSWLQLDPASLGDGFVAEFAAQLVHGALRRCTPVCAAVDEIERIGLMRRGQI